MSFAKVYSAQTVYLNAHIVDVEVDLSNGMHSFAIVGLGDKAVEESKDRVSAAIKNSGFKSPKVKNQKVVVSLAPADIKKEGPLFDLGMAVGYLLAAEEIDFDAEKKLFLGELSLDGELRRIPGILPLVKYAKEQGFTEVFLPEANAKEAALIDGISIYGARTLTDVIAHIDESRGKKTVFFKRRLNEQPLTKVEHILSESLIDFQDIKGQEEAKRGLLIAAAGGHNIAMYGPPGTGKTMLAKAFCHILPPLSFDEILETTSIHSIAGTLHEDLLTHPPFRSPHHSSSHTALIGGGGNPKPGEITLAHKGVLFLDEFPEFDRRVIDSLRQPLEDHVIHISRTKGAAHFPAHFILVAAMNPCPCGNNGIEGKDCRCSPPLVRKYQQKISGPIVDRIDIWIEVSKIDHEQLSEKTKPDDFDSTENMSRRVSDARARQAERFKGTSIKLNSEMSTKDLEKYIHLSQKVKDVLNKSAKRLSISARSYHRIIKLAQTIADLNQKDEISVEHMIEAFRYRPKEREL